jgi:putative PIN family toxin of toxin-antitoxin system
LGAKKHRIKRVVLDTNIFISALLFEGKASGLVDLWMRGEIIPLVSSEIMQEIIRVLAYPRFDLGEAEIKSIINEEIMPYVETVKISRPVAGVCRDHADDIFLACAVNGKAEAIISGDIHLLSLKEYEGIPVLKITDILPDNL